jgi:hypothetical protein
MRMRMGWAGCVTQPFAGPVRRRRATPIAAPTLPTHASSHGVHASAPAPAPNTQFAEFRTVLQRATQRGIK